MHEEQEQQSEEQGQGSEPTRASERPAGTAVRRREVVVAGHTGDAPRARAALGDPEWPVRAAAVAALARCGQLSDSELDSALADPAAQVRRRAALVAGGHTGAAPRLLDLLEDPEDTVAEVAAFALGERPHPGREQRAAVSALGNMARTHHDSLCRESAVAALGALGDPAGLEAVLAACEDRATVRRRAVLALAAFDDERCSEMLRRLSGDRDLQVRQAAADLLAIEEGEEV